MTFQQSLLISISVHILAYGGAFAFAQHGHMLGQSDVISIILVEPGSNSGKSLRQAKVSAPEDARDKQMSVRKTEAAREDDRDGTRIAPATVNVASVRAELETRSTEGVVGISSAKHEARAEAGSPFGILTPDQWQLIQAALERAKTYPRLARERGIEGIAHIRFKILPSGAVERVELVKSSGHDILDAASVRTVYQAGTLPYVKGWIEVPIAYYIMK